MTYDVIFSESPPPPNRNQLIEIEGDGEENGTPIPLSKKKKKFPLVFLAIVPVLGAMSVGYFSSRTPKEQPQVSQSEIVSPQSQDKGKETEGIDLKTLISEIESSKGDAKKSVLIARENLDYAMVGLLLGQMREANKDGISPDKWWLAKAKISVNRFISRAGKNGDFTSYEGIKNWQIWLTEVNALLLIHDYLIETGKGNAIQSIPNPNLAVSLSQFMQFVTLSLAGDTQAMEQMRAIKESLDNSKNLHKETQEHYDKSLKTKP